VIAERRRHPTPMLRPMKFSIYTLFGAALTLGAFDTVAVGTPVILLPWVAGAGVIAGVFWFGYGRSFESDVVVATWRPAAEFGGGIPPSGRAVPGVVWRGGRVRSDIRGRTRTAVRVAAVPELAGDLAEVARLFSTRLDAATTN
jgi:hypothetical protein